MAERLSNKELTEIINDIERNFDVNSLRYKGINFWPFIRVQLIYVLWAAAPKTGSKPVLSAPAKKKNKFIAFLDSYKIYRKEKILLHKNGMLPYCASDLVFVTEGLERKETIDGKKVHPFANSIDALFPGKKYTILDYNYVPGTAYYGGYKVINVIPAKVKLIEAFRNLVGFSLPEIEKFKEFERFLEKRKMKLNYREDVIRMQLEHIFLLAKEFEKLFKKILPEGVFFSVYFKEINFALSLACRKLGIKSVEIQHGQQGLYSPQNNGFARVPPDGYELLPSHFWVWGTDAASYKKDLCAIKAHKCVIAGNSWLNAWLHTDRFEKEKMIIADEGIDNPGVLVALQPMDPVLPDFLLNVIRETKDRFFWRFRLHPVMKSRLKEISGIIEGTGCAFDIVDSTEQPLYQVLKKCKFVITQWSTVAYEGLYFGLHPVIIHQNGKDLMNDYIEQGFFSYAPDKEKLLGCLLNDRPAVKVLPSFIETNHVLIEKNLKAVFE